MWLGFGLRKVGPGYVLRLSTITILKFSGGASLIPMALIASIFGFDDEILPLGKLRSSEHV